jgi:hypothetical protein
MVHTSRRLWHSLLLVPLILGCASTGEKVRLPSYETGTVLAQPLATESPLRVAPTLYAQDADTALLAGPNPQAIVTEALAGAEGMPLQILGGRELREYRAWLETQKPKRTYMDAEFGTREEDQPKLPPIRELVNAAAWDACRYELDSVLTGVRMDAGSHRGYSGNAVADLAEGLAALEHALCGDLSFRLRDLQTGEVVFRQDSHCCERDFEALYRVGSLRFAAALQQANWQARFGKAGARRSGGEVR